MQAKKVNVTSQVLMNPGAPAWSEADHVRLALQPTPIASQPSVYVRAAWKDKTYGKIKAVKVAVLTNGADIFFRLEWDDPDKNDRITDTAFPDGAAILFPIAGDAPILTMGDQRHPVNAWHWRADLGEQGRNNVAHGLGTTVLSDKSHITCSAVWEKGVWRVVISRPLAVSDQPDDSVQLKPGQPVKFAVAVWEGHNGERAGIKAFSQTWWPLTVQ